MNIDQKKFYCVGNLSDDVLKYLLANAKYNGSDTLDTLQSCVGDDAMIIVDIHGRVTCSMLEDAEQLNTKYIKLNIYDFLNLCDVPEELIKHELNESLKKGQELTIFMSNRNNELFDCLEYINKSNVADRIELSGYLQFFK